MRSTDERIEISQFESLIQGLIDNKFGCCDDFFSPEIIAGLRSISQELSRKEKTVPAGIGAKSTFQQNTAVRNDKIKWIEDHSVNPFELIYLSKINRFISYLNSTCFTDIKRFESHYATFEIGSFYKRHIDQFKTLKGRQFSIVLYLNEEWTNEDGGHITLYGENSQPLNILPVGGRIVFFRSNEMEHEVQPSFTRDRRSIACWLKND